MSAELEDIHEECGIFGVWGHPDAARLSANKALAQKRKAAKAAKAAAEVSVK